MKDKAPTYRRQRLLLFLLEEAGGRLDKLDFQKLLFLYTQDTASRHYAFVPYKYGSYSFSATHDLDLLQRFGWIDQGTRQVSLRASLDSLPWARGSAERRTVRDWLKANPERGEALVRDVYNRYPYYAIRSKVRNNYLDDETLASFEDAACPQDYDNPALFTLGYEGLLFEEYVNKLIRNKIVLVCDVRRNPLSRKFGFSKRTLAGLLPKMGIVYEHVPGLGIEAKDRRNLKTDSDYEALLSNYHDTLPQRQSDLDRVKQLLLQHGRIALTCFEHDPHYCHRRCVSTFIAEPGQLQVVHL